ncbi:MarR family winged helix-turn-helix transcriptional regulator [Robertmurraya sp. Marseille-Q9965]
MDKKIEKIKRFNRFYLNVVGLYAQYTEGSPYSISEAMILYEINQRKECTATDLSEFFNFDKGYVSRMIHKLSRRKLIERLSDTLDKRKKYLHITEDGKKVLKELSDNASNDVRRMIEKIDLSKVDSLIQSMEEIEKILSENQGGKNDE